MHILPHARPHAATQKKLLHGEHNDMWANRRRDVNSKAKENNALQTLCHKAYGSLAILLYTQSIWAVIVPLKY